MEVKYVATINLTSLDALTTFIRTVKEVGGNVSIGGVNTDFSFMSEKSHVTSDIRVENIFMTEIRIFASSTNDIERARAVLNYETGESLEKSAAYTLLESVANFTGGTARLNKSTASF